MTDRYSAVIAAGVVTLMAATGDAQPVETVRALAPTAITQQDVGRFVDVNFRFLEGQVADRAERHAVNELRREQSFQEDRLSLEASIGTLTAEARTAMDRVDTSGYVRAVYTQEVAQVAGSAARASPDPRAVYYIRAIYFGRLYERRFMGRTTTVRAAVEGTLNGIRAAGAVEQQDSTWHEETLARGYRVVGPEVAVLASDAPGYLEQHLQPTGQVYPVIVEYQRVQQTATQFAGTRQLQISIIEFQIDGRKPNGWPWEGPLQGHPDPGVSLSMNGSEICRLQAHDVPPTNGGVYRYEPRQPQQCASVTVGPSDRIDVSFWELDDAVNDPAGGMSVGGTYLGQGRNVWASPQTQARVVVNISETSRSPAPQYAQQPSPQPGWAPPPPAPGPQAGQSGSPVARQMLRGTITTSNHSEFQPGLACVVDISPAPEAPPYTCRIAVQCGGVVLYGAGASGYNMCDEWGGAVDGNPDDGDPAMSYSPRHGTVTVRTRTHSVSLQIR